MTLPSHHHSMALLITNFLEFKGGGHNFGIVTRFTLQTHRGDTRVSFRAALDSQWLIVDLA